MFFLPKNYYANFSKGIIEVTGVKVQFKFPQRELIIFFLFDLFYFFFPLE